MHQHWADAIFEHDKDVENRTWKTDYRGDLLIHAGRSKSSLKLSRQFIEKLSANEIDKGIFGCIIGKVTLIDCVRDSASPWAMPGQFHWILSNPIKCKPVVVPGKLSLWDFEEEKLLYLPITNG